MDLDGLANAQRGRRKGQTLVLVAMGLVMIIAMAGLAIDLASLYVARSEAQRAADAGALAGAKAILDSGYISGAVDASTAQALARQHAMTFGNQNSVGEIVPVEGQDTGLVQAGDVSFNFSNPRDPRVTVLVQRSAERGNPVPTFFMKIFGVHTADVSAAATAEVYFGARCVKPWMIPNCDAGHTVPAINGEPSGPDAGKANKNCPTVDASGNPVLDENGKFVAFYQYYVYPPGSSCDPTVQNCIVNPGPVPDGIYGKLITIKPSPPSDAAAPGKFYPIYLEAAFTPASCPDCAQGPGGGGIPSGAVYRENIACCNQKAYTGGFQVMTPITGNMVGPTASGVDCLIHEGKNGTGQDTLDTSSIPYKYRAGANNPLVKGGSSQEGDVIADSDSVVSVPLFDGSPVCPGFQNCPATVTVNVHGFLQIFIEGETNGTVTGYILGVAPAGAPPGGPGNAFAVRLIHE